MSEPSKSPDWEKLLAHAALLQAKVPSAVLVGGTAAALHAGHRISFDHDHVLSDLGKHFDEANAALESIVGWRTKRRIRESSCWEKLTASTPGCGTRSARLRWRPRRSKLQAGEH